MSLTQDVKRLAFDKSQNSFTYFAKKIIFMLLHFAVGILVGGINDLGVFSPFGIAYVTAIKQGYLIVASAGTAVGYILTQDSVTALRYLAAVVSAAVTVRLLGDFEKIKKFKLLPSFVCFFSLLLTSFVMLISRQSDLKAFLIFFGEASLGFVCAYFFSLSVGTFSVFKEQGGFNIRDISGISLSAFTLLLSFEKFTVFELSFSRIIATLFILLMSYVYKQAGGVLTSVAAALVFSVSESVGPLGILFAASGFVAGAFAHKGKYATSGVYFTTYLIMFILNSDGFEKWNLLLECLIACVIFSLIKYSTLERLSAFLTIRNEPKITEIHRRVVSDRLKNSSRAIENMLNSISAASGILEYQNTDNEISIYSKIKDAVCEDCRHKQRCWENNFEDCKKAFDEMGEILKNCSMVNRSNIPSYISGCCVNPERLADVFNRSYLNYIWAQANQKKIEKIRQITAEQFNCVYTILSETSQPLAKGFRFDTAREERVEEMLLNRFGLKAESVVCLVDANDKIRLELSFSEKFSKIRENDIRSALEQACETEFDKPVLIENGKAFTLYVCQKTKYRVEIAAARVPADREKHCGDNFESFYDGKGNYTVILSDGMGTGMRACVDSSLAVCVCGNLLRAGFDYDSVIRLTNCAMLLKSVEESLATLDILKINLYTGEAEFFKAGATVSFIKKNEKITEIRQASMPIGILSEVNFSTANEKLSQGNIVMLASDGAFEYSQQAVKNSLAVSFDEKVEEIAERSATKAKKSSGGKRNDDITVITVRLVKNR